MFSIGEFARLGAVSVRTLRHYDDIGLLQPATVDPGNGYRGYSGSQLGRLNRIVALKELGLSLSQVRGLLDGVTPAEMAGMLILRRAQLEQELDQHKNQLLGVEARLRSIAREDDMPAAEIVAKTVPATGVVVIAGQAPAFGPANIVPVVNQLVMQYDQLEIPGRIRQAGPRIIFYEYDQDAGVTVFLALPVTEPPAELPAAANYRILPEIEAAAAVRSGPAATIFPMVYADLVRWIEERGYHPVPTLGREVWVHDKDDPTDPGEQVFEIQMPFTRPAAPATD